MAELTDKLNALVADFVKARDADGTYAGADEAYAVAQFCADIFEKPFYARTDDGLHEARVPHKSSQDAYSNTWQEQGHGVSTHTLKLLVFPADGRWRMGKNGFDQG